MKKTIECFVTPEVANSKMENWLGADVSFFKTAAHTFKATLTFEMLEEKRELSVGEIAASYDQVFAKQYDSKDFKEFVKALGFKDTP